MRAFFAPAGMSVTFSEWATWKDALRVSRFESAIAALPASGVSATACPAIPQISDPTTTAIIKKFFTTIPSLFRTMDFNRNPQQRGEEMSAEMERQAAAQPAIQWS